MSFPNINFKYNDLDEAVALSNVVEQKLSSLSKFIPEEKAVTCDVEFEKAAPQKNGSVFRFEVNMLVDGTLFRAEATEDSFEKAIGEVRDELDKEMRRSKSKQETLDIQAGRDLKQQMLDAR